MPRRRTGRKRKAAPVTLANPPGRATPERIAHAGQHHTIGADGVQRLTDGPLGRLRASGLLHPQADRSAAMAATAEALARRWQAAGLTARPAQVDLSGAGGGRGADVPEAEWVLRCRDELRDAECTVGPQIWRVLVAVVCEDTPLVDAGRAWCGYRSAWSASTAALTLLRAGLEMLAVRWGYL